MAAQRLYASGKRRREVQIKKSMIGISTFLTILFLSILAGNNLVAAHGNTQESPIEHKYYKSIEIASGDTLWDIAEEYVNSNYSSINEYIDEVKQINNLSSDNIKDSQFLTVAYYDTEFK